MDERCDKCKFWIKGEDDDDELGGCHRNAPRPTLGEFEYEVLRHLTTVAWKVQDDPRDKDYMDWEESRFAATLWPITKADSWCGEFQQGAQHVLSE